MASLHAGLRLWDLCRTEHVSSIGNVLEMNKLAVVERKLNVFRERLIGFLQIYDNYVEESVYIRSFGGN